MWPPSSRTLSLSVFLNSYSSLTTRTLSKKFSLLRNKCLKLSISTCWYQVLIAFSKGFRQSHEPRVNSFTWRSIWSSSLSSKLTCSSISLRYWLQAHYSPLNSFSSIQVANGRLISRNILAIYNKS